MAAELHRHALHMQTRHRREVLADLGRAGEGDLADGRVRDQIFRNLGRHAVNQIDHAGRHAGIDKRPDQFGGRGRGFFRRLDDDRAARGQGCRHLLHHLVDREIPGRERGNRSDRLLERHLIDAGHPRRDQAAIGPAAFLGEPVDDVGGGHGLELGFGQHLALFHGHDGRDLVGTLAHQIGGLAHHLGALIGRDLAPGLETFFSGRQRLVEVGLAGMRDGADHLFGRRIEHGDRLAGSGGTPFSVDQQLYVRVIHFCFLRSS